MKRRGHDPVHGCGVIIIAGVVSVILAIVWIALWTAAQGRVPS